MYLANDNSSKMFHLFSFYVFTETNFTPDFAEIVLKRRSLSWLFIMLIAHCRCNAYELQIQIVSSSNEIPFRGNCINEELINPFKVTVFSQIYIPFRNFKRS